MRGFPQVVSFLALTYAAYVVSRFWAVSGFAALPEGKFHIVIWTLGPPLYFFAEYLYHYRNKADPTKLAQVKAWQELAGKIWAGLLAAMLFLGKVGG